MEGPIDQHELLEPVTITSQRKLIPFMRVKPVHQFRAENTATVITKCNYLEFGKLVVRSDILVQKLSQQLTSAVHSYHIV